MTWDESQEFGEEAREIIAGLRHSAARIETPAELLPQVLSRGEHLFASPPPVRPRRRRTLGTWLRHPALWAPAVALASFFVGVFVPPPPWSLLSNDTPAKTQGARDPAPIALRRGVTEPIERERRQAMPAAPSRFEADLAPQQADEGPQMAPGAPVSQSARPRSDMAKQRHPVAEVSPSPRAVGSRFRSAVSSAPAVEETVAASSEATVTTTVILPKALHERLSREAEQRNQPLSIFLRELLESYSLSSEDAN